MTRALIPEYLSLEEAAKYAQHEYGRHDATSGWFLKHAVSGKLPAFAYVRKDVCVLDKPVPIGDRPSKQDIQLAFDMGKRIVYESGRYAPIDCRDTLTALRDEGKASIGDVWFEGKRYDFAGEPVLTGHGVFAPPAKWDISRDDLHIRTEDIDRLLKAGDGGATAEKERMVQAASAQNPCADFLALPNLSASEVSIEFATGESGGVILNVSARNVTRRLALAELDLFDRRKSEMNEQGGLLLGLAQGRHIKNANDGKTSKQIGRLRKALKSNIGIKDDPIPYQDGMGYLLGVKVSDKRGAADARAKLEAERRKVSLDDLQERGVQFGDHGQGDYCYETTDKEMAGDAADKWLRTQGT